MVAHPILLLSVAVYAYNPYVYKLPTWKQIKNLRKGNELKCRGWHFDSVCAQPAPGLVDRPSCYDCLKYTTPDFHFASWMSYVNGCAELRELSLPGTHDSLALHGVQHAKAQRLNLDEQLRAGIRILDVRPSHTHRHRMQIYHGAYNQKISLSSVIRKVVHFLRRYPTETVLMRIQSEGQPYRGWDKYNAEINRHIKKAGSHGLNKYFSSSDHIAKLTLAECRNKIVFMDATFSQSPLYVQDDYSTQSSSKWHVAKAHFSKALGSGGKSSTYLWVNFLTSNGFFYPSTMARYMNPRAAKFLYDGCKGSKTIKCRRVGVVFMDFPGFRLIREIVKRNPFECHPFNDNLGTMKGALTHCEDRKTGKKRTRGEALVCNDFLIRNFGR